jgi:hypothetical protein
MVPGSELRVTIMIGDEFLKKVVTSVNPSTLRTEPFDSPFAPSTPFIPRFSKEERHPGHA